MFSLQPLTCLNCESAENRVTFCVSLSIPQQMDKDFVNSSGEKLPIRHEAAPSRQRRRKHIFTVLLAAFLSAQTWAADVGDMESVRPNTQAFDREVKECAE